MGILFVLIIYAVVLTFGAAVGSSILGAVTYRLTKDSGPKRKSAITASRLFPFACVAFAGIWFIGYAVINYAVFHRDAGLGDSWQTPLPNGYALMMIDTTDQGTVYNPRTQPNQDSVIGKEDTVFGVRELQVSKALIFGARDTGYFSRIGRDSKYVDSYFELDTSHGKRADFGSLADLRLDAARQGISLNLRDFDSVFNDYRNTWFDYLALVSCL